MDGTSSPGGRLLMDRVCIEYCGGVDEAAAAPGGAVEDELLLLVLVLFGAGVPSFGGLPLPLLPFTWLSSFPWPLALVVLEFFSPLPLSFPLLLSPSVMVGG